MLLGLAVLVGATWLLLTGVSIVPILLTLAIFLPGLILLLGVSYLVELRRDRAVSVLESRRRAHRGRAVLRHSKDPIVGVYLKGARRPWGHGAHLAVLWDADHPDGATEIVILRWFPPRPTVEPGPPLAELPSYLDDRRIGILPVGKYSDWIWDTKFAPLFD